MGLGSACSQPGPLKHEAMCLSMVLVWGGIPSAAMLEIIQLKRMWCCLCSPTAEAAAYEAWSNLFPGLSQTPAGLRSMVCFKKLECFCCTSNIGLGI